MKIDKNITNSIQRRRKELNTLGYSKLSKNIFEKDNEVVILKSVVKTTNKYEEESVSIKEKYYQQIKDKHISLEIFKRNCFRSVDYEKHYINVFQLVPTYTYRSKKTKTMRYKVQTLENIFNLSFLVSINNTHFIKLVS